MLAYIGLLAIICFVLAFKGRKLPQCYNDAKFITFSMLIYFMAWIIFGPVYNNVDIEYHPALEMVVIVISAYAILFCQFLIKCYIILFKQEKNTEAAFREEVREFSYSSDRDMERSRPDGVQNVALSLESLPSPESFQPLSDRRRSTNTDTQAFFPVSNAQPALPSSVLSLRKKPLQRFSSLPT